MLMDGIPFNLVALPATLLDVPGCDAPFNLIHHHYHLALLWHTILTRIGPWLGT